MSCLHTIGGSERLIAMYVVAAMCLNNGDLPIYATDVYKSARGYMSCIVQG